MSKLSLSRRIASLQPVPPAQPPNENRSPAINAGVGIKSPAEMPSSEQPSAAASPPLTGWGDSGDEDQPTSAAAGGALDGEERVHQQPHGTNSGDAYECFDDPVLNDLYDYQDDPFAYDQPEFLSENEEEEAAEEAAVENEQLGHHCGGEERLHEGEAPPWDGTMSEEEQQEGQQEDEGVVDLISQEQHTPEEEKEGLQAAVAAAERRLCQVCGADLSAVHYLQQVSHVKQCISRRQLGRGNAAAAATRPPAPPAVAAGPSRSLLAMDIKDWLKELKLQAHAEKFIAEEVDMTVVHALSEEDLRLLGITDLLQQRQFLRAAQKVGAERAAARRSKRAASGPPPGQQRLKQAKLHLPGMERFQTKNKSGGSSGSTAVAARALARDRSAELALLTSLYPAGGAGGDPPQPTPPLPSAKALAAHRVAAAASLFTSAASCAQVTDTLEARIEKRREQRPEGTAAAVEPLARGGVLFTREAEGRALKAMKLEALKQELATHEATVGELKRLIRELESELGQPP